VIKELLAIGEELRKDTRSIKEIVQFDEEELTDAKIENKTRQTLRIIDKIEEALSVGAQAGREAQTHAEVEEARLSAGAAARWGVRASRCRNWCGRSSST